MGLEIRSWLEPFPSSNGVAVVFDVFRCSTTIHTLLSKMPQGVWVAPSLKSVMKEPRVREMRVFSELSQPITCRERFDNSPHQALTQNWNPNLVSLVATTTGTPAMFASRFFERVYVGSLVNFSSLVTHLIELQKPITLVPAAFPEAKHVEDEITAQAMATALEGFANLPDFVRQCASKAKEEILASGRPDFLSKKLSTGLEDVTLAMDIDRFSQIAYLSFESELFAQVKIV
jgi:phosphosulfolactate phosphohydrolase-like enzyme